ncbi:MAG: Sporulation related domain protein [Bacteroidetes bacterium ADurb.Bin408]|nr:MAG: Sporulation related domain protein [Bacteroidetes bacterium ADurb.Bin408]
MNIEKDLIYLLTIQDKVVLAGFGYFSTEQVSAEIHPVHHTFEAPSKKVTFTSDETNFDNTLVNYLSTTYNTPKAETINIVNNYISEVRTNIEKFGRFIFEGFGVLTKNEDGGYNFELNNDINLSVEAFGMENFTSPAIKREKVEPTQQAPKKRKSKAWLVILIIFVILTGAAVASWFVFPDYVKKGMYYAENQYYSIKDKIFSKDKKTDSKIDAKDDKKSEKKKSSKKDVKNILEGAFNEVVDTLNKALKKDTLKVNIEEKPVKNNPPVTPNTNNQAPIGSKMYYIVAGSFKSMENGQRYVDELKTKGYPNALMLDNPQNGFYTVAYCAYADKQTADQELKRINDKEQKGSWIICR